MSTFPGWYGSTMADLWAVCQTLGSGIIKLRLSLSPGDRSARLAECGLVSPGDGERLPRRPGADGALSRVAAAVPSSEPGPAAGRVLVRRHVRAPRFMNEIHL